MVVIGIEPDGRKKWSTASLHRQAGGGSSSKGDIETIAKASWKAKEFTHWASEIQREECVYILWISVNAGIDTTSGLASNPTVGNLMDKLEPLGCCSVLERLELTGAEQVCAERAATPSEAEIS